MENRKNGKINDKKIAGALIIMVICLFAFNGIRINTNVTFKYSYFQSFTTVFISIILEASFFILLGSFISAIIQVFISEKLIARIIPKNKFLGYLCAASLGLVFPVCECAIVPITKRLMKKGVPMGCAVTFMLAVPIVNPVVILSTYYAFTGKIEIVIIRCVCGIVCAILIGFFMDYFNVKKEDFVKNNKYDMESKCACGCESSLSSFKTSKIRMVLNHTSSEFLSIMKYLIFGAFVSSLFQVFFSRNAIAAVGHDPIGSVVVMMMFAYIMSVCSEADAFIAKTFLNQFTIGSISAFLILGPMIDIKNTFMLCGNFKGKFVARLILFIIIFAYFAGVIVNILSSWGFV